MSFSSIPIMPAELQSKSLISLRCCGTEANERQTLPELLRHSG